MFKRTHPITKQLIQTFLVNGFKGTIIHEITQYNHAIRTIIQLPEHKELNDLIELLPNLQQELQATDSKIENQKGKIISILFGKHNIEPHDYKDNYLTPNTLKIKLPTSFGYTHLDFEDGASCHLLNGGTTRMGKTSFLLYITTLLYLQTKGNVEMHITSTKLKDFYPFQGIQQVHMHKSEPMIEKALSDLIMEYKVRNQLLYSKELEKATDAKSVKERYPNKYYLFKPIFLIIDEYARFSANKDIQQLIMELVETAGYVNIHVIISTQRPDARTVLSPRIKANLLARICFTTADKNNSLIILDHEGAEQLGKIKGRALFLDSDLTTVQVPYMDSEVAYQLLKPYRKEVVQNDNTNEENQPGSNDIELSKQIQNMFKESTSPFDFP